MFGWGCFLSQGFLLSTLNLIHIAEAGLEPRVFLPLPPECYNYRHIGRRLYVQPKILKIIKLFISLYLKQ